MTSQETFRPLANLSFGIFGQIFSGALAIAAFVGEFEYRILCLAFTLSVACYLVFLKPKIIFSTDAIKVINPLFTHIAGWGAIDSYDTKNNFYIRVNGKNYYSWAAPSSTRYASRGIHASEIKGLRIDSTSGIKASQSPRSHSGVALALAARFFNESSKQNTNFRSTTSAAALSALVVSLIALGFAIL